MAHIAYINHEFQDFQTAQIPALDRGFLFGDNCFEVLVCFGSKILNLSEHLTRLFRSLELLGIETPWPPRELSKELQMIATKMAAPKGYIRIIITRGSGLGLFPEESLTPNKYIFALPARIEPQEIYKNGLSLKTSELPYTIRSASAKTGNYLQAILELKKAKSEGFSEILWVNSSGEVTESSTSNIFFVLQQKGEITVVTPPPESGLLLGITRQTLLKQMQQKKISVEERIVKKEELSDIAEAFLCSTVRGLVPVSQIDCKKLPSPSVDSFFRKIEALYLEWVATQVGAPVDWNPKI